MKLTHFGSTEKEKASTCLTLVACWFQTNSNVIPIVFSFYTLPVWSVNTISSFIGKITDMKPSERPICVSVWYTAQWDKCTASHLDKWSLKCWNVSQTNAIQYSIISRIKLHTASATATLKLKKCIIWYVYDISINLYITAQIFCYTC